MPGDQDLDVVRRRVLARSRELRLTLADMSRRVGKNAAYMHQFIYRGTPRRLPEEARERLAELLQVPQRELRPDAWPAETVPTAHESSMVRVRTQQSHATRANEPTAAVRDLPVFRDTDQIEPEQASEWTLRPSFGASGEPIAFAVWITAPRGRLEPGDLAFVHATIPPRRGDIVVALRGTTIAVIGELLELNGSSATIKTTGEPRSCSLADHRLLKVIGTAYA